MGDAIDDAIRLDERTRELGRELVRARAERVAIRSENLCLNYQLDCLEKDGERLAEDVDALRKERDELRAKIKLMVLEDRQIVNQLKNQLGDRRAQLDEAVRLLELWRAAAEIEAEGHLLAAITLSTEQNTTAFLARYQENEQE